MVARQLAVIKQTMATISALIRHLPPIASGGKPAYVHSYPHTLIPPYPHTLIPPCARWIEQAETRQMRFASTVWYQDSTPEWNGMESHTCKHPSSLLVQRTVQ